MLTRVAAAVVVVAGMAAVAGTVAEAHHSASSWGAYYRERYLLCAEKPWGRAHCVGVPGATPTILAALAGGTADSDAAADAAHAAAIDAVYFDVTAAIPALRTLLAGVVRTGGDGHRELEDHGVRAEAAYALAQLGDATSAPAIAALAKDFETTGHGTLWIDTVDALATLDPAAASTYALGFIGRTTDWRLSMPGGTSKLDVLAYVRLEDAAAARPVLEKAAAAQEHGYDHAYCLLMGARVKVDPKLRAAVRKQFVKSYSGSWLAGCANDVLPAFGSESADVDALVRHLGRDDAGFDFGMANIAYQRILALIASGKADGKARAALKKGLVARSRWGHVADPKSDRYQLHYVVFHQAALAGLGDAAAQAALYAIVDDPQEQTGAAWVGALWALRLGLPDAVEHAAALIERGATYANGEHSGLYEDVRAHVLDAFVAVAPTDPRWTVLLLDGSGPGLASERAMYLLSRLKPAGACEAVTRVAPVATPAAVEHALLALTSLGGACRPAIEALFADASVAPEVRGTALELSAVLGSPQLAANIATARAQKVWRPAVERAALFLKAAPAKPAPAKPGDRPLPPRAPKQGL